MVALDKKILSKVKNKPKIWHTDDIFFWGEDGEESVEEFINEINSFYPPIKLTADWSNEKPFFWSIEVTLHNGVL